MTRCCDRKQRAAHSITSLKVILCCSTTLCCAAIGLGLYGNDDLHNGLLEVLTAGRNVDNLVSSVRNQVRIILLFQTILPIYLQDLYDIMIFMYMGKLRFNLRLEQGRLKSLFEIM
jgi:hypothetical protein